MTLYIYIYILFIPGNPNNQNKFLVVDNPDPLRPFFLVSLFSPIWTWSFSRPVVARPGGPSLRQSDQGPSRALWPGTPRLPGADLVRVSRCPLVPLSGPAELVSWMGFLFLSLHFGELCFQVW